MITEEQYLMSVSQTHTDLTPFIDEALKSRSFMDLVVNKLLFHKAINVYYHSWKILSHIAEKSPSLLTCYLEDFKGLFKHPISYHRNYVMDLISLMASRLSFKQWIDIFGEFMDQLDHDKVSVRKQCIVCLERILKVFPSEAPKVIKEVREVFKNQDLSEKHRDFLAGAFLHLIENCSFCEPGVIEFFRELYENTTSAKLKKEIKRVTGLN